MNNITIFIFCFISLRFTLSDSFHLCDTCSCSYSGNDVSISCNNRRLEVQEFLPLRLLKIDSKSNLISLTLSNDGIKYIPVLQNVPNLLKLNLTDNSIRIINDVINRFEYLQELDLSFNKIKNVSTPLSLKFLRNLNLSHCKIDNLDGLKNSSLPNLTKLNLSHNRLTFIDEDILQNSRQLSYLDLSFNRIETIDLSGFLMLAVLNIEQNLIGSNAYFPKYLEELYASHNRMTIFPRYKNDTQINNNSSAAFNHLKILNLSDNELTTVLHTKFASLEILDLSKNNFTTIPKSLTEDNFPSLKKLLISGNMLQKIEFSDALKLENLVGDEIPTITSLDFNKLQHLESHDNQCLSLSFRNNPQLKSLEGRAAEHSNICYLDLSHNNLTHLHSFLSIFDWRSVKQGIDFQGNPINCDCDSQIILDEFVPWIYSINVRLLANLRCVTPNYLSGLRLVHWYKWERPVFCDQFSSFLSRLTYQTSEMIVEVRSSNAMLITLSIVMIVFIALTVTGLILARKNAIKRSRRNRRF